MISRKGRRQRIEAEDVAPALEWLRTYRNLSVQEAAKRAGLSAGMVSGYEGGAKVPGLKNLLNLLEVYEADLADLQYVVGLLCLKPAAGKGTSRLLEPATEAEAFRDLQLFGELYFGTTPASKATRELLRSIWHLSKNAKCGEPRRAEAGSSRGASQAADPLSGPWGRGGPAGSDEGA